MKEVGIAYIIQRFNLTEILTKCSFSNYELQATNHELRITNYEFDNLSDRDRIKGGGR